MQIFTYNLEDDDCNILQGLILYHAELYSQIWLAENKYGNTNGSELSLVSQGSLREKFPNTELFLARVFLSFLKVVLK